MSFEAWAKWGLIWISIIAMGVAPSNVSAQTKLSTEGPAPAYADFHKLGPAPTPAPGKANSMGGKMDLKLFGLLVVGIVVLAGILGGSVGELLRKPDDDPDTTAESERATFTHWTRTLLRPIILGISAASLIPLFLETADSRLLEKIYDAKPNESFVHMLVLFGFCLLAAMSSQRFLTSMSNRFMQDIQQKTKKMESAVTEARTEIEKARLQNNTDLEALDLVDAQLSDEEPDTDSEEVRKAVAVASPSLRTYIFRRATDYRRAHWRKGELMDRVIPIFRGLAEADGAEKYHRTWGELGFALKDSPRQDFGAAEAALSKAISIRDKTQQGGYKYYEFNRGFCRAALDNAQRGELPSAPSDKQSIISDLRAATEYNWYEDALDRPEIQSWLQRNNMSKTELIAGEPPRK